MVVIDGSWRGSGLKRAVGRFLVSVYERRNPFWRTGYDGEVSRHLPLHGKMTQDRVVWLMESAGLGKISVTDLGWIRERLMAGRPLFYRLAWEGRSYFLVEGIKGV